MLLLFCVSDITRVYAVDTVPSDEMQQAWEARKSEPVQTNLSEHWPTGPQIGAKSAILMEADTGNILYGKNIDEKLYPASITKMMTALLTVENCTMEEIVTFSNEAIDNTEWGSSRIGIMKGEQLTVADCLYGLLLGSANEVAYGLAEHVGGDLETFVQMMNDKAASLGCTNTHFANASGLPNEDHYVSAYDMALIAQEFFNNDTLCMISGTYSYTIPPTNKTDEKRPMENHHKMVTGKKYEYDGIVGGKTGFTSDARQTLVTCAQKEGMKLICVVMKDESPYQFLDTKELFDYGFTSFQKLKISDYETRYNINSANFFHTNVDIMGSSKSILTINDYGYVVIPKTIEFDETTVQVDYRNAGGGAIATLNYYVGDNKVGTTTIDYASNEKNTFEFANIITDASGDESYTYEPEQKTVFITASEVFKKLVTVIGMLFLVVLTMVLVMGFIRSAVRARLKMRKRYKQRSENNRRYNYKKRSENKKRKAPIDEKGGAKGLYIEPLYNDLSDRTGRAADSANDIMLEDDYVEGVYYDDETIEFDEEEAYEEERSYRNYPVEDYGVTLSPLNDPNRWDPSDFK